MRAFLFADPAAHSLSPLMHRAAFQYAGLKGTYEALRIPADALPQAVAGLRTPDVLGANLSLPHKEAALHMLDGLTPAARAIGAVNTVIHQGGHLLGENTDAPGFRQALLDAGYTFPAGAQVVLLGAGGAARAAVYALLQAGQRVQIVNRTPQRAEALARDFHGAGTAISAVTLAGVTWDDVSLIVNSSSAGLSQPQESPLPDFDFARLPAHTLVYDMVYKPAETRLMREARRAGLRAENGLGMLAHQARLAFQAWTGAEVPVGVFLGALGAGL